MEPLSTDGMGKAPGARASLEDTGLRRIGATPRPGRPRRPTIALRITVLLLACGAIALLFRLWVPLVLATWFANLARPAQERLATQLGGHSRAAGALCVILVLLTCAAPLGVGMAVAESVQELLSAVGSTVDLAEPLRNFAPASLMDASPLLEPGAAVDVAGTALALATDLGMQALVFVVGFYTVLVHHDRGYRWLLTHSPIRRPFMERLAKAYSETGRGLLISFGMTALAQGAVATLGFLLAGVPNPLAFGALTAFASFVPVLGTALVTVPLTAWFIASGDQLSAVIMGTTAVLTGLVDNPMRAYLSKFAHLELPSFLVFASMLGGLMVLGPAGLLAGPLVVRLALEAMRIWKEEEARTRGITLGSAGLPTSPSNAPPPPDLHHG